MGDTDDNDPNALSLEEAMERYANDGDPRALSRVFDIVAPRIEKYARRRTDDEEVVTRVVKAVFRQLHRQRGDYVGSASVLPWAFSFAQAELDSISHGDADERIDDETRETLRVRESLAKLKEPLRSCWELVVVEGFDAQTAAGMLGMTAAQVRARTQRAVEALRSREESDATEEERDRDAAARPKPDLNLEGVIAGGVYRIEREIGSGGMAWVYEAKRLADNARGALKVMKVVDDETAITRFEQEHEALLALRDNKHIVRVFEVGELPTGHSFYAMERLQGSTVREELKRAGRLPWSRVREIALDVCTALEAVHDKGFVHRDLKPSNLFLTRAPDGDAVIKLLDFGIAKAVRTPVRDPLTRQGRLPGTLGYTAPERLDNHPDDPRFDLYSLGVTMFELLTGSRPFWRAEDQEELELLRSNAKDAPPLRDVYPNGKFTAEVESIVRFAIERDPKLRVRSARDLAEAIRAVDADGHGELPAAFRVRAPNPDWVGWALAGSVAVSAGTLGLASIFKSGNDDRLPHVGSELRPAHVEAGLARIQDLLAACDRLEDAPTEPIRVKLGVLGATGEVIDIEMDREGAATEHGRCLEEALYHARFGTFDQRKQIIARDL